MTPFHMDLANLTQEQLDRALANPGSCAYSGPCILGAMMPPELVEHLRVTLHPDTGGSMNAIGIPELVKRNLVTFDNADALDTAWCVQRQFDGLTNGLGSLRVLASLLPHLKVPETLPGVTS